MSLIPARIPSAIPEVAEDHGSDDSGAMSRFRRLLLVVAPLVAACSGSEPDYRVTVDLAPPFTRS